MKNRLEKKKRKRLPTTKKILWICLINGLLWVWCSYALAFIGTIRQYESVAIAESLSSAAVTEVVGVVLVYCLKSLFEKRKDFGEVGKVDEYGNELG